MLKLDNIDGIWRLVVLALWFGAMALCLRVFT